MRRIVVLGVLLAVGVAVVGRLAAQGNVAEIEQVKGLEFDYVVKASWKVVF